MQTLSKNFLYVHLVVLLVAFSSLFGKLITLPALTLILGRIFFSSMFLFVFFNYNKETTQLAKRIEHTYFALMGIILVIHCYTFFQAVQLSTVAISLLTFSIFPLLVPYLEPYFFKEKLKLSDIIIANIMFCGILLIVPNLAIKTATIQGMLYGFIAGSTYANLSLINRKCTKEYCSLVISLYEQAVTTTFLLPFLFSEPPNFTINDILLLMILGTILTVIAHELFIHGLKNIRTKTSRLIAYFEPMYGIIIATITIQAIPTVNEIFGAVIILGTVLYHTSKQTAN
ncbi:MAG: permease [Firmicutes bacterium]|nr:permease [Bacillota bacterium]